MLLMISRLFVKKKKVSHRVTFFFLISNLKFNKKRRGAQP